MRTQEKGRMRSSSKYYMHFGKSNLGYLGPPPAPQTWQRVKNHWLTAYLSHLRIVITWEGSNLQVPPLSPSSTQGTEAQRGPPTNKNRTRWPRVIISFGRFYFWRYITRAGLVIENIWQQAHHYFSASGPSLEVCSCPGVVSDVASGVCIFPSAFPLLHYF